MLWLPLALAIGYLLGSLPSAQLAAQIKGRQIFQVGSGSMGAMNTARNLGWVLGVMVLLVDIGKGALASYLGLWLAGILELSDILLIALPLATGLGTIIGHVWSLYVGFKGGKGLATLLGVSLPLFPLGGLIGLLLLIALVLLLRRATLASALTVALYPLVVYAVMYQQGASFNVLLITFIGLILMAVVIVIKYVPSLRQGEKPIF